MNASSIILVLVVASSQTVDSESCGSVLQIGLGVHPDDENMRVPLISWETCAFTMATLGEN